MRRLSSAFTSPSLACNRLRIVCRTTRSHPERPLPPVGLGDVHPTPRLGPVRSSLKPVSKLAEVFLQSLAVVPPRLAIHPRRRFPLKTQVSSAEPLEVVDVVQERREPHLPIPGCCQAYSLQRTLRACLALSPGRVGMYQRN
jgi:hypothetical protein